MATQQRSSGIAIALAVLIASAARADGRHCGDVPVSSIEIDARDRVDRREIYRVLGVQVGDSLPPDLEDRRDRLLATELYRVVEFREESRAEGCQVVIQVERWPVVARVRFSGHETTSTDELTGLLRLPEGTALRPGIADDAVERIAAHYRDEGFAAVEVQAVPREVEPGEMLLDVRIVEGAATTVAEVVIQGEVPPAVASLDEVVGVKAGDRYTVDRIREAEKLAVAAMRRAGYYEADVSVTWTAGQQLIFEVTAGPKFTIEIDGNKKLSDADILDLGELESRIVVTNGTWKDLARRAQRAYEADGYYFAKVRVTRIASRKGRTPTKRVVISVEEGDSVRVGEVRLTGNHHLTTEGVLSRMDTRPPSWIPWRSGFLVQATLEDDLDRIEERYLRHGYRDATARVDGVTLDAASGGLVVAIAVDEGVPTRFATPSIELLGSVSGDRLSSEIVAGEEFDPRAIENEQRRILSAVRSRGYFDATVDLVTEFVAEEGVHRAHLTFRVVPGAVQQVGDIVVRNNVDTKARIVRRELPFREGDTLTPDLQANAEKALYRLGLFRSVLVTPVRDSNGDSVGRRVIVDVRERAAGVLNWGVGYNTRDGFNGFGQVGYSNLGGLGRSLMVRGEIKFETDAPAPDQYLADVTYRVPRPFDSQWAAALKLVGERTARNVDQYSMKRVAFVPSIERPLTSEIRGGSEFIAELADVFDVDDAVAAEPGFDDERTLRQIGFAPFLVRDGRDDSFNPSVGSSQSLVLRLTPTVLGTQVPVVKLVGQHSQYLPIPFGMTIAYALRAGWARVLSGGDEVPIRERFFVGGRTSVRGFSENQIGPRAGVSRTSSGSPLGGDLSVTVNTELIVPLWFELKGVAFSDAGALFLQDRSIRVDDIREASGVGLRYTTPVGALAFDYGFKTDRRDGESLGQLHFSVGTSF